MLDQSSTQTEGPRIGAAAQVHQEIDPDHDAHPQAPGRTEGQAVVVELCLERIELAAVLNRLCRLRESAST